MKKHFENLLDILLNKKASIEDRDDAAMDLFEYNNDLVLNTLITVAKDKDENPIVLNSCGESMASIWVNRNEFDENVYNSLSQEAKNGVYYVLKHDRPDWISKLE